MESLGNYKLTSMILVGCWSLEHTEKFDIIQISGNKMEGPVQ